MIGGESTAGKQPAVTNKYRLYGLHYGDVVRSQGISGDGRSIDQLHAQLLRDRQNHVQQDETMHGPSAHQQTTTRDGRDFFVSKRFDVGEFEQDLRNVHNAYQTLERKIEQNMAQAAPSSSNLGDQTQARIQAPLSVFGNSEAKNTIKEYRQQLIQEGVISNFRTQLQKQDTSFYSKILQRFEKSVKEMKSNSNGVRNNNSLEVKISMPPLSQAKLAEAKDKLPGDRRRNDAGQEDAFQQKLPKQGEAEELDCIIAGKPVTSKIDKAYMKRMQSTLAQKLSRWSVNQVSLMSPDNTERLGHYQPPVRKLVYEKSSLPPNDRQLGGIKAIQSFTRSLLRSEERHQSFIEQ